MTAQTAFQKNYLSSVTKQFQYYKLLGDRTFEQLEDKELFWRPEGHGNSIAIIVNHMYGNMKSRWTDFLTTDGEKEWRNRDAEFENCIHSRSELLEKWEKGWLLLFSALDGINDQNFSTEVYIRNMGHTIVEAINRQLSHYSYHVGQLVFIGTLIRGSQWNSLSIPKGASKDYNTGKFSQPKRRQHFTKDFLDE